VPRFIGNISTPVHPLPEGTFIYAAVGVRVLDRSGLPLTLPLTKIMPHNHSGEIAEESDTMLRNTPIRMAIIGGQILFRDALASSLALEPDFRVMGGFSSLEDAAPLNRITPVSIVLLSFDPGQETGASLMAGARKAGFHGNILVVTSGLRDREVLNLMEKGCAGIFLKSQPMSMLHQRIRSMASDRPRPTVILATMARVETRVLPIFTPLKRPLNIFNGNHTLVCERKLREQGSHSDSYRPGIVASTYRHG
jgi:hypothetical protein